MTKKELQIEREKHIKHGLSVGIKGQRLNLKLR